MIVKAAEVDSETQSRHSSVVSEHERRAELEQIVIAKLAFYARIYLDIDFVVLDSTGNTMRNMELLYAILGRDPDPLDYSHPQSLRTLLLEVTYARIQLLLQHGIGSATLFSPGKGTRLKRKQVCVITLNPWTIARDNLAATGDLLELPEKFQINNLPADYLDADSHLRFAIDHEIYHCLDTSKNGPVPMSMQAQWGNYYMRKNEAGADAFGILMHLSGPGKVTSYVRNLGLIRGLALLNGDPNHYTYPVYEAMLQLERNGHLGNDVQDKFRIATRIRDKVVGSYEDYLRYASAAQSAMKRLGVMQGDNSPNDGTPDPAMVEKLTRQVRINYFNLVGRELGAVK